MSSVREAAARTLAIVPARGGSRGIPRKNIRQLGGHPLLAFTLATAEAAGLGRVVLSTEDEEIAEVGRGLGFDVPFLRPEHLAGPETATVPVLLDVLARLREREELSDVDYVCLLQPTSPLRQVEDIDRCLDRLSSVPSADSAVTVRPVPAEHNPHWVYRQDEGGVIRLFLSDQEPISRRQDLPPVWHRDGSVYLVRRPVLEEHGTLYGKETLGIEALHPHWVNLDTLEDWRTAELLVEEHPSLLAGVNARFLRRRG